MGVITNRPQGLISVLGLRDLGDVPRDLLPQVMPTVELTEFLLVDREVLNANNAFNTVTTWAPFVVPAGELWRVHQWGFRSSPLLAAERIQLGTYIGNPNIVPTSNPVAASTTGQALYGTNPSMFWARSGAILGLYVSDIATAGTIAVETSLLISRFRV